MTLTEIIGKIEKREMSFSDLAEGYLKMIKEKDGQLHAFLSVDEDGVRRLAKRADEQSGAGKGRPLFGIPYAVKDNMLVKDAPCTAASRILENYKAPYNATVIDRLQKEGAIVLGKTNLDEFAMGSSTENSAFGPTRNPIDHSRVPGGSSGGSAAAVAAGLAAFALGSDTGGSIRQPAAFCGIVGFKPTYGAVSRHGLIAMASSLDQIGTLTHTVADAQIVFEYIRGKDEMDATSHDINPPQNKKPHEIVIGIPKEYFAEGLDSRVKEKVQEAIEVYKKMGATVKDISLPHTSYGLAVYYILMPSEVSSNLARYDGMRYGRHATSVDEPDLLGQYLRARREGFGPEVRRRIMLGTYTLSAGYYDAYYLKAQKVRTLITQEFARAFGGVDVVMSPTTPTPPFKFGEKTKDSLSMYLSDMYTVGVNLAGLPSISIPVGSIKEDPVDLPVGLQIIGPQNEDVLVLEVASWYEEK